MVNSVLPPEKPGGGLSISTGSHLCVGKRLPALCLPMFQEFFKSYFRISFTTLNAVLFVRLLCKVMPFGRRYILICNIFFYDSYLEMPCCLV